MQKESMDQFSSKIRGSVDGDGESQEERGKGTFELGECSMGTKNF